MRLDPNNVRQCHSSAALLTRAQRGDKGASLPRCLQCRRIQSAYVCAQISVNLSVTWTPTQTLTIIYRCARARRSRHIIPRQQTHPPPARTPKTRKQPIPRGKPPHLAITLVPFLRRAPSLFCLLNAPLSPS